MTEPLRVRWDRTVIHSTGPGDPTIVCCLDQHGRPVALFLDDELREALGLQLLLPDGDGEVDPQHLELARENERLRAELLDFTHPVVTCFGCHHIAPWHVGSLGAAERPCTQRDCNCTDLVKETSR